MNRFYVNAAGVYIGNFIGTAPPAGAVEVPVAPAHAGDIWGGAAWQGLPMPVAVDPVADALDLLAAEIPAGPKREAIIAKIDEIRGARGA